MTQKVLDELVGLSQRLGDPAKDYVILGEGNTSAKIDEGSFYVKASGMELASIGDEGFCEIYSQPVLDMLREGDLSDDQIKQRLTEALVHNSLLRPSVETVLHAHLLNLPEVGFVAHTHPQAVLALLCAKSVAEIIRGRIFPDEIVSCGVAPVFVPYTDPGLPLAKAVHEGTHAYVDEYGERPRAVLMQNHGLIALGDSPKQCEAVTAMWVKVANVLLGAVSLGGPSFLTPEQVERIHTRPDEEYRRKMIDGR
jgi:rhamnose utilization protein RhaD (predicted bifunctional aldolase and dehydrogenase)